MKEVTRQVHQKAQFQQVNGSVRGMMAGGVSHIHTLAPYEGCSYGRDEVTKWKEEHDPIKIERISLERNRDHFRRTVETPFTKDLMEWIPFTADSEIAENVLEGEKVEGPTMEATQILKSCTTIE